PCPIGTGITCHGNSHTKKLTNLCFSSGRAVACNWSPRRVEGLVVAVSRLAWSLLFCAALALRLWAGIGRLDMIWPDEHFQTLEPAGWVIFGHGFKTWEWQVGYRSWVVPAFFMPVLWACKQLGVLGGT